MKVFTMFLLAVCCIAADVSFSEAGPLRNLINRLRHRHGIVYRVVHREVHFGGRRCEAEVVPAPQEERPETGLASAE